ncbi:MAG: hypothetical protein J6Z11_00360, partial [Candidatus Riflebacteria bacterium]|nr:hypothetical protein [Candidatus Riflebacteria bacterium]
LLNQSGILGKQFAAYTKKLQDWVNKRNALRYVRQIVARLDEETVPPEIDKNVIVTIKQPLINETFKEALTWPISNRVKSRIYKYLGIPEPSLGPTEEKPTEQIATKPVQAPEKSLTLTQLELLANITPEKAVDKFNQILLMITNKESSTDLKIAALQCLTRCRISGAEDVAVRLIKHKDIPLATASVEYLGIVNPDCVFPYLGQCLKISDIGMKSAALGILKNYDYNQAISYLKAMLYSTENSQQNMAMECLNQFDFALVRDMLTDFLCLDYPEALLEAGLCHFAANPSADNVYSLYKIEQAHPGKIAEQAKKLREACPEPTEELATNLDQSQVAQTEEKTQTKESKEEELKERLRVEKEKKASKRPAYAYRSPSEMPERTSKQQLIEIWEVIKAFVQSKALPISIIVLLIVIPTVYYTFIYTNDSNTNSSKGGAVVAEPTVIEGQVTKINEDVVTVKATNDETYILTPLKDGWKVPTIGKLIRAQIVPYRRAANGEVAARIVRDAGYRYIDKYSEEYSGKKAQ